MGMMGLTHRGNESMSQKAQSMTKFPSDNMSEGSKFLQSSNMMGQTDGKKMSMDKYKTTNKGSMLVGQASGTLVDLKIENSKN